jgi:cellulose synthase/poly-beta-1,6-N-acetylglucosamine synthase-like glycosyltransferase
MVNFGVKKDGISVQEKAYLSREVMIKHRESVLWGAMIGPFGGCYSIRKSLYTPVPSNFLVDDFYINMQVLRKGYRAINDVEAMVHEDVSNNLNVEFRRKVRIATGNFQNLMTFAGMLWPPFTGKAFSFFSHKVLRWKGPFFILMAIISSAFLAMEENCFYIISLAGIVFLLLLPLLDAMLKKFGIHIILLRFITHFVSMNIALLFGFFKFLKGVRTNVWKPTKRNQ